MAIAPTPFGNAVGSGLASYDFYDLATGTGYKTFHGIGTQSGATLLLTLTTQADLGGVFPGFSIASNAAQDLDFDIEFEVAIKMKGQIRLTAPLGYYGTAGSKSSDITAIVYHVDADDNETQIGTTASRTIQTYCVANQTSLVMFCGIFDTGGMVTFAPGEKLRLSITTSSAGANGSILVYHSPNSINQDVDSTTAGIYDVSTMDLKLNLPLVIDI